MNAFLKQGIDFRSVKFPFVCVFCVCYQIWFQTLGLSFYQKQKNDFFMHTWESLRQYQFAEGGKIIL